ncbi:restriction endonuclease subunit S [Achromobacter aloeverae]
MEVKLGYKQTEVGVIPEDWKTNRLGELSAFITSGSRGWATHYTDYGALFIRSQNIRAGRLDFEDYQFVKPPKDAEANRTRVKRGDLLITITGNSVGNVALVENEIEEAYISQHVGLVRLLETYSGDYICRFLSPGSSGNSQIWATQSGQSKPGLTLGNLLNFEVAFPPTVAEQRAIATALSDMDALLDGLDRLITKKHAIKQAAMQQLLTGQTRLPGFNGEWKVKRLEDLVKIQKGQLITTKTLTPGDIPVIAGGKQPAYFHASANRHGKTITVSASGASAGYVALHLRSIFASDCSTISESDSYSIEFIYCSLLFRQNVIYAAQTGGAQPHVQPKDLAPLSINIPDDITEQTAIASVFSDMDAEITALETRRTKTRALKQAMMQELLTGRTRLVTPSANTADKAESQTEGCKANVYFLRSVLAAEIIDQLHDQPTFGHVKFEKIMFLAEHLCQVDTGSTYQRKAAGPYDNRALRSIDSQLQKQQWFEARKQEGRYQYVPLAKRGGHKPYFERHFSGIAENLEKILGTFKTAKTEQCEIVATLLAAWSDLLREKGTVSDEMIVHEVLHNWHEAKQRIPEERWLAALGWMREKGFVPKGVTLP